MRTNPLRPFLLIGIIFLLSVNLVYAQGSDEGTSPPPPAFTPGSVVIIPNEPAPQTTSSTPEATQAIQPTTTTPRPTPSTTPKVPVTSQPKPTVPVVETPENTTTTPSSESNPTPWIPIALGTAGVVGVAGFGTYQIKKKVKAKSNPCFPIQSVLNQAKKALQKMEAEFSLKQAALNTASQKMQEAKNKAVGKIQGKVEQEVRSYLGLGNIKALKTQIFGIEDKVVAWFGQSLSGIDFSFDPVDASSRNLQHLVTIPNTGIKVFLKHASDQEKIFEHFKTNELYPEIKKLKEIVERSEAVQKIEKAKGNYEYLVDEWDELQGKLKKLEQIRDNLWKKVEQLEQAYNTCTLGVDIGKIKIPSWNSTPQRVLVLGASGSGKTYLSKIFAEKNMNAMDAHAVEGLGSQSWDKEKLSKLIKENPEMYLFGHSDNAWDTMNSFDKVYFLKTHPEVLQNRVSAEDYEKLLALAREAEEKARRRGIPIIDSSKTPEDILKEITG